MGVSGTVLDWFSSYLSDSFSVLLGPYMSETVALSVVCPRVLSWVLYYALYTLPLSHIINKFKGISYHCYADDIQLHVSFKPYETDKLSILHNCLIAIKDWRANNFLQLNTDKTQIRSCYHCF